MTEETSIKKCRAKPAEKTTNFVIEEDWSFIKTDLRDLGCEVQSLMEVTETLSNGEFGIKYFEFSFISFRFLIHLLAVIYVIT